MGLLTWIVIINVILHSPLTPQDFIAPISSAVLIRNNIRLDTSCMNYRAVHFVMSDSGKIILNLKTKLIIKSFNFLLSYLVMISLVKVSVVIYKSYVIIIKIYINQVIKDFFAYIDTTAAISEDMNPCVIITFIFKT